MLWAFIMFFCLELDRSNISQANADNFLNDLGLTTNDFNLGTIVFRLSFLSAGTKGAIFDQRAAISDEINIRGSFAVIVKAYWARCLDTLSGILNLTFQSLKAKSKTKMVLWSIVACSQFWLTGRGSFLGTRCVLYRFLSFFPAHEANTFRCLLGFLQGGFIPDIVLYLSYFYNKNECKPILTTPFETLIIKNHYNSAH